MANYQEDAVRSDMRTLAAVMRELRRTYPRMELGQAHVLLLVLARPGISMAELAAPTKLTKSAISRNTKALSQQSYLSRSDGGRRDGLNLLTQTAAPDDARAKLLAPTTEGRLLAECLSGLMQGGR